MMRNIETPIRPKGQKSVLKLACEPIDTVRIGVIGLGIRATRAIHRFMMLQGVEVRALCDLIPENVAQARQILEAHSPIKAGEYINAEQWKLLCERDDIDLVYICTD